SDRTTSRPHGSERAQSDSGCHGEVTDHGRASARPTPGSRRWPPLSLPRGRRRCVVRVAPLLRRAGRALRRDRGRRRVPVHARGSPEAAGVDAGRGDGDGHRAEAARPCLASAVPLLGGVQAGDALWLGVAVAIVHSRYRRPVLSVARAVALTGADRVVELGGRRSRWLGVLASRRGKEAANLPDGAALDAPRAAVATIAGRAPRTATVA